MQAPSGSRHRGPSPAPSRLSERRSSWDDPWGLGIRDRRGLRAGTGRRSETSRANRRRGARPIFFWLSKIAIADTLIMLLESSVSSIWGSEKHSEPEATELKCSMQRPRRGFTLIELLVVIAIIAVL